MQGHCKLPTLFASLWWSDVKHFLFTNNQISIYYFIYYNKLIEDMYINSIWRDIDTLPSLTANNGSNEDEKTLGNLNPKRKSGRGER